MELPKNITQIGETDKSCKIYVEDYVMSYMKQMNRFAEDKEIAIALYGRRSEEQTLTYCFVYGACKLDFLQRNVRHLSQAQHQEIERLRKKYFSACEFIGYIILNGEMIEGVHIAEANGCRFVKGYACFYEKNDPMLAYMLDNRVEETPPETVSLEKYEEVRRRQEERRQEYAGMEGRGTGEISGSLEPGGRNGAEQKRGMEKAWEQRRSVEDTGGSAKEQEVILRDSDERAEREQKATRRSTTEVENHMKGMRFAAAGMFVLLCMVSVVTLQTDGLGPEISNKVKNLFQGMGIRTESEGESLQAMSDETINTLVAEEQLANAIKQENAQGGEPQVVATNGSVATSAPKGDAAAVSATLTPAPEITAAPTQAPTPVPTMAPTPAPTEAPTPVPTEVPTPEPEPAPVQKSFSTYTIRTGDTLIGISMSLYGSEAYVETICELNNISNPDNIQIGQKILLP